MTNDKDPAKEAEKSPADAAAEAWALAWAQMVEAGAKAIKSNSYLATTKADDVGIAETPCDVVFEIDKVRLFHYRPLTDKKSGLPPVIICYGLFGRQTMIDLQEDRSLVRNLLNEGIDVYVVDWGTPTRVDQFLSFDDYIELYLGSCVDYVREQNNNKPINMFGICEGGTFATMLVAMHPEKFAGLALAITPIDFHGDPESFWSGEGFLNHWTRNLNKDDIDLLIDTYGMLPGAMTGAVFSSLTPINSMTKYNIGLAEMQGDKDVMLNFLRMEKWIADRPDHPGMAARQWLNDLYRENRLVEGTFEISGEKIDLKNISCPVLNIYALKDHIIPVSCTKALSKFIKPGLYEEIGFPGGHVGVFVSRKAQGVVAGGLCEWLERQNTKKASQSTRKAPAKQTAAKKTPARKTTARKSGATNKK